MPLQGFRRGYAKNDVSPRLGYYKCFCIFVSECRRKGGGEAAASFYITSAGAKE